MLSKQNVDVSHEGKIKAEAFRLGFSLCGFTSPEPPIGFNRFESWLTRGDQAGMVYLNSIFHRSMRQNPDQLVPGVKTIISLAWPYFLQPSENDGYLTSGLIAGYAAGMDYHILLPAKMESLICYIQNEVAIEIQAKSFTDSAPILEREIASRAGLGWIGKNTCLISPKIGSSFLLAEILIDFPLQKDQPFTQDRCGTCHRCLDACPTHCIQEDRTIDSNRCISYLTIENKGPIDEILRPSLGKWIFGCDVCQTVCPWNKGVSAGTAPIERKTWTIDEIQSLLLLSSDDFALRFKGTSLFRSKLMGFQRNALIWLGNNGNENNLTILETFKRITKDAELVVCADWAIRELTS